jgi:polysaccharide pyruvyl transferase WcaK-like protein
MIVLFTATGAENLGDELITLCEIRYFQETSTEITLFSHNIERTRRFLLSQNISLTNINIQEYFPNALRKQPFRNIQLLWRTIKTIKNTEHVYVGGGGLLYSKNEEWHSPLRLWWMRAMIVHFFKKPLTYLSLGISTGPEELKPYAKWIFEKSTITVRDTKSQETLKKLSIESEILPDPVLNYSAQKTQNSKIIGIALRKWFLDDEVTKELIKKLLSRGYEVLLLPHSLHPTDEASHDGYYLQDFLFPGVMTTQSIEQTLEAYKKCHIIISMRLHSMILALTHHIPFVGVSYSQKTAMLLEEINWKYSHSGTEKTDDILRSINIIEWNYSELESTLAAHHAQYQSTYKKSFPWR